MASGMKKFEERGQQSKLRHGGCLADDEDERSHIDFVVPRLRSNEVQQVHSRFGTPTTQCIIIWLALNQHVHQHVHAFGFRIVPTAHK